VQTDRAAEAGEETGAGQDDARGTSDRGARGSREAQRASDRRPPGSSGDARRPARGRPAAEGLARRAASGWSLGVQLAFLVAVFAVVVLVAELAGAANLGVALGVGQIAFAIAVTYLLVRR
jgi:hypothetical protein